MQWLKSIFIGRARNHSDERLFHKINQHDALTLGRWLKKVPVAIAV